MKNFALLAALLVLCFGRVNAEDKAEPPKKLLTPETRKVIESHEQRYGMSCIPMSVEMVLKLLGRATGDFYDLQNAWKNKSNGNFSDFDGKTIKGVTFHKQFGLDRDDKFPLEKLFATIEHELKAGRYVIISLASGNGWHMWVICGQATDGEFTAFSKDGKETLTNDHVKRTVREMKGTDILTCEVNR